MKKTLAVLLFALMTFGLVTGALAEDSEQKFFVSLTSDNMDRAAMAVAISSKVLSSRKIPVTIFLSAQGVRWVDTTIPQNKYVNGKTIPEMLQEFMKAGGQVILCKMCMTNVGGIKEEEVINGVKFSGALSALFAENTTVLSY